VTFVQRIQNKPSLVDTGQAKSSKTASWLIQDRQRVKELPFWLIRVRQRVGTYKMAPFSNTGQAEEVGNPQSFEHKFMKINVTENESMRIRICKSMVLYGKRHPCCWG